MRKLRSVFFMCFIVFLFAVMPQTAKADELTEIDTRSTVIIKANVPDGFDENIAFVLEQETTQVRFAFALTADNDYTGKLSVLGGKTYLASAVFASSSEYNTDLAEKYDIEGAEVELIFNVTAVTADSDDLESADSGEESSHVGESSEAIDPETGLPSAESVIAAFEEKVSFIQDDPAFSSFLSTYSGAMFKKYYLQADTAHTEEQWESMKEIERFCYNITYYSPYIAMMNYEFSSADEMIDELVAEKNILSQIENGDIVYDAIVEVWKWHYDYWQHTGTFCNFYNNCNGDINAGEPTASETVKLTDEDKNDRDKEEIEEIKNEIQSELAEENTENGNSAADWFKDNWLIVTILLVVVIAFLAVFLYKRSKNISGKTEK